MTLQAELFSARQRGAIGMERVRDAVEAECPGWTDLALEAIRRFAVAQPGGMWTTETMRWVIEPGLPKTERTRVWGPLVKSAVKAGYLEATGVYAPTHSSNGSPRQMYRKGPKA